MTDTKPTLNLVKRNGGKQEYSSEKILKFLKVMKKGLAEEFLDEKMIEDKLKKGVSPNMTTVQLIKYLAETIAYMNILHPDFSILAARVTMSGIHKQTTTEVLEYAKTIYDFVDFSGRKCSLLNDKTFKVFEKYHKELQEMIDYNRDMDFNYFGLKTLEKSYLVRINRKIVERPQQLLLRVAIGIHGDNIVAVRETYNLMS